MESLKDINSWICAKDVNSLSLFLNERKMRLKDAERNWQEAQRGLKKDDSASNFIPILNIEDVGNSKPRICLFTCFSYSFIHLDIKSFGVQFNAYL